MTLILIVITGMVIGALAVHMHYFTVFATKIQEALDVAMIRIEEANKKK